MSDPPSQLAFGGALQEASNQHSLLHPLLEMATEEVC
jgi:hypothetical protein